MTPNISKAELAKMLEMARSIGPCTHRLVKMIWFKPDDRRFRCRDCGEIFVESK